MFNTYTLFSGIDFDVSRIEMSFCGLSMSVLFGFDRFVARYI